MNKPIKVTLGFGVAVGAVAVLLILAALLALVAAFPIMLVVGALFPTFGWATWGFWQTVGVVYLVSAFGTLWNGTSKD